jgi:hypothetical protein
MVSLIEDSLQELGERVIFEESGSLRCRGKIELGILQADAKPGNNRVQIA